MVWVTPTKKEVKVNLSLKFGTFYGYTQEDGEEVRAIDNASQHYIGTECHGVMWQADSELPHGWPVAPPIVAGKVGTACSFQNYAAKHCISGTLYAPRVGCSKKWLVLMKAQVSLSMAS